MMELVFNANKIARTMTRQEWREVWRWRRVTQKELRRQLEARMDFCHDAPSHLRTGLIDAIVNPPLVVYP